MFGKCLVGLDHQKPEPLWASADNFQEMKSSMTDKCTLF